MTDSLASIFSGDIHTVNVTFHVDTAPPPMTPPSKTGLCWIDYTSKVVYFSIGTESVNDWRVMAMTQYEGTE